MNEKNYTSLEEFLNDFRDVKIAVNCEKKREAKEFLIFLKNLGYEWLSDGDFIINGMSGWFLYRNATCYLNGFSFDTPIENRIAYCDIKSLTETIPVIKYKSIRKLIVGDKVKSIKCEKIEKFLEDFRNLKIGVNCKTKEEAKDFLFFFKNLGYSWFTVGDIVIEGLNTWEEYESRTCYVNEFDENYKPIKNKIYYANTEYFEEMDIQVIEYEEFKKIMWDDTICKLNIPRSIIKFRKVYNKKLKECVEITDIKNVLSEIEIINLLGEKYGDEYLDGLHYHLDGEGWIEITDEDENVLYLHKGGFYTTEEFDKMIKLIKKAGERFAKLKKSYEKELIEEIKKWEDGKIHEIKI